MATHDYVIANQSGAAFRTDLNNALAAIVSNNSNSSEPSTKYAYQWWADTSASIFKIRNSSNNAWINLFTLAGGIDVDAASNFNEDVTFTGASANIVFDKSDSALEFADNAKAKFGTGSDLLIFHDATDSHIQNTNNSGELKIRAHQTDIKNADNNETQAVFHENDAVELYFDNARKLKTNSLGFQVGTTSARFNIESTTNSDGSQDIGRVGLNRDNNSTSDRQVWLNFEVGASIANAEFKARAANDTGTAGIYLKVDAVNNRVDLPRDNQKLRIGLGNDLELFHDGTNSVIQNGQGNLTIAADDLRIRGDGEDEHMAKFIKNSAVELYFDNSKKLETYSNGVNIATSAGSGDLSLNVGSNAMSLILDRNARITSGIRGSDGTSNIAGGSGGGSRITLNKTQIDFFTYPHVSNIGDSVTFTERFRVTTSGATVFGSLTETSDIALKENFRPITNTLEKLKEITGYIYNFKRVRGDAEHDSMGVVAQDVEKVFPEIVQGEEGQKTLQYTGLIGVLIEAVKELTDKVAALESAK